MEITLEDGKIKITVRYDVTYEYKEAEALIQQSPDIIKAIKNKKVFGNFVRVQKLLK